MASPRFIKKSGDATVYENLGFGRLNAVQSPEDLKQRGGDFNQVQEVQDLNQPFTEDINNQVNAQIDPQIAALRGQYGQQQQEVQQQNQRLVDQLKEVYARRRQQDPLARQGIYSGAAAQYQTGQEVKQYEQVNQDLTSKLSAIAQALSGGVANLEANRAGLRATLQNQYSQNAAGSLAAAQQAQREAEQQAYQRQQEASRVQAVDLGNEIAFVRPDGTIVRSVRKGLTPSARAAGSGGIDSGTSDALIAALTGGGAGTGGSYTENTLGLQPIDTTGHNKNDVIIGLQQQVADSISKGATPDAINAYLHNYYGSLLSEDEINNLSHPQVQGPQRPSAQPQQTPTGNQSNRAKNAATFALSPLLYSLVKGGKAAYNLSTNPSALKDLSKSISKEGGNLKSSLSAKLKSLLGRK